MGTVVKWGCSDLGSHQSSAAAASHDTLLCWLCRVTPTTNKIILCTTSDSLIPYFEIVKQPLSCPRQSPLLQRSECCHHPVMICPALYPHLVSSDTIMSSPDPVGGVTRSCYHSATLPSGPSHTVPHAPQYYIQSSWREEELNTPPDRLHLLHGKLLNH